MMSIERYVGQSTIAFIYDVAYAYRLVNECRSCVYEPRRFKICSSKEIVGECKYIVMDPYFAFLFYSMNSPILNRRTTERLLFGYIYLYMLRY